MGVKIIGLTRDIDRSLFSKNSILSNMELWENICYQMQQLNFSAKRKVVDYFKKLFITQHNCFIVRPSTSSSWKINTNKFWKVVYWKFCLKSSPNITTYSISISFLPFWTNNWNSYHISLKLRKLLKLI